MLLPAIQPQISQIPTISIVKKQEPEKPKDKLYTIKDGDTLTSISNEQGVSVSRLWSKNHKLSSPNSINALEVIEIPQKDEVLEDRPLPAIIEPTQMVVSGDRSSTSVGASSSYKPSASGNLYSYGYCTWYVKNRRPDMPNDLGNADTWYYRYQGSKGSSPAPGAVAVAKGYMHVAIVEEVKGDQVLVSEMNYQGWNVISQRWTSASEFFYLY